MSKLSFFFQHSFVEAEDESYPPSNQIISI